MLVRRLCKIQKYRGRILKNMQRYSNQHDIGILKDMNISKSSKTSAIHQVIVYMSKTRPRYSIWAKCNVWCKPNTGHTSNDRVSTVRCGGGSIMVWEHFLSSGPLVRIGGRLDGEILHLSAGQWSQTRNQSNTGAVKTKKVSKSTSESHWESEALYENYSQQTTSKQP